MTVWLVGAGPGDPGLLTVRGAEVLARADVVVHDRLAEASLLDLAPAGAERVDVGKSPGGPVAQDAINAVLVERGRAGLEVVRLKGGDPFVFGRGGEEAEALRNAGVPFQVVPGITSAVAVPAYAGIPVTHRGLSTSFTVVTGHSRHNPDDAVDWESLARVGGTVVVLMGVAHRAEIARRLMDGGRSPSTPVAAVRWGTRPDQHTVRTTLAELGGVDLEPPVTIVIGAVAGLELVWFERRPLLGRRVVITRAAAQASGLAAALDRAGAEAVVIPTIKIVGPADGGAALAGAAARLGVVWRAGRAGHGSRAEEQEPRYDWVAFTSANAVERLFAHLPDARALGGVAVAAVGAATADALAARGVRADVVPRRAVAEALVEAYPSAPAGGGRVLLPQSAVARATLAEGLAAKGWEVDVVEAYRTVPAPLGPDAVARAATADAIAFTSASTVDAWVDAAGAGATPPVVGCIGPVTADAARRRGLEVATVAAEATIDGLVGALAACWPPADGRPAP
ncbi:MAG: uroporphyrinogen-III C-methyltransferase [Acidimicrobiales bacterium]